MAALKSTIQHIQGQIKIPRSNYLAKTPSDPARHRRKRKTGAALHTDGPMRLESMIEIVAF